METSAFLPGPAESLVIGVLTFRRTERLRDLLPLLLVQCDEMHQGGALRSAEVIVVDNDPAGSAATVVADLGSQVVRYCVEPRRGISYARNRVLDEAATTDLLAFIDDDETPRAGWLRHLVETQARTTAAAVAGRVVSKPDGELDPFVAQGGFLDRAHRAQLLTGAPVSRAATNNLLLDLRWVRRHGLRFDERFALTGGEDSVFTSTLTSLGGRMVWCDEAVVTDHVPAARMTPDYMLAKSFYMANSTVFVELALRGKVAQRLRFRLWETVRQLARTAQGTWLVLRSWTRGSLRDRARGRRALARSAGAFSALAGHRAIQYAATDGPVLAERDSTREVRS